MDTPFDIPESWEWIRFKDLVDYSMGKTPPRKETEYWSNGKLVSQDPSDEPAEALLERIRAEKQRLIKEGKIKKDKHESIIFRRDNSHYEKLDGVERCIDDELPFEIPENWCWCKIGTIFTLQAGKNIQAAEIHENPFAESYPCYGGNGIRGYPKYIGSYARLLRFALV